jgi:hypothetical protein
MYDAAVAVAVAVAVVVAVRRFALRLSPQNLTKQRETTDGASTMTWMGSRDHHAVRSKRAGKPQRAPKLVMGLGGATQPPIGSIDARGGPSYYDSGACALTSDDASRVDTIALHQSTIWARYLRWHLDKLSVKSSHRMQRQSINA